MVSGDGINSASDSSVGGRHFLSGPGPSVPLTWGLDGTPGFYL